MVTINYPEGSETTVSTTKQEFEAQVRLMAALKMSELGKLYFPLNACQGEAGRICPERYSGI
jgi:hypothetical protein